MFTVDIAKQYIQDAAAGKNVGKLVQKAFQKHLNEIKHYEKPDSPYYLDEKLFIKFLEFCSLLNHIEGDKAGEPILLDPWQQGIMYVLLTSYKKKDNTRRYNTIWIEVARKNGKTLLCSLVLLFLFMLDSKKGVQAFNCANKQEQSRIVFNNCKRLIQQNKHLQGMFKLYQHKIIAINNPASTLVPLGWSVRREDGWAPSLVTCDEIHEYKSFEILEVMRSGTTAHKSHLTFLITTAGLRGVYSACFQERENILNIINGTTDKPNTLGFIYTLDPKDDWTKKENWIKANPSLGSIVLEENLTERIHEAQIRSELRTAILAKNLNIWMQDTGSWIDIKRWDDIQDAFTWDDMQARDCIIGMDLSSVRAMSALCYCFLPTHADKFYRLKWHLYLPGEGIINRCTLDKVDYLAWQRAGCLTIPNTEILDYDLIVQQVKKDGKRFKIHEIAYDPRFSTTIIEELKAFTPVPIKQWGKQITPLIDAFSYGIYHKKIRHDSNLVARYHFTTFQLKTNAYGEQIPHNPHHKGGVTNDSMVAAIMAYGRAVTRAVNEYDIERILSQFQLWG